MFAVIETNGATHIVIHVPADRAAQSLPALALMLERNATFINKGWRSLDIVTPTMSITLGNKFESDQPEIPHLIIHDGSEIIDETFYAASPERMISQKAAIEKKDSENAKIRKELEFTKQQLANAHERIKELLDESDSK